MITNGHINNQAAPTVNGSVQTLPLSQCRPGLTGVVYEARLDPKDGELLRAMGLRPHARVRVCRLGEPCIVEIFASCGGGCSCRIGLSLPLARLVMIAPD